MEFKRLEEQTTEELLKQLEDDRIAQTLHKRFFQLQYSLSEKEMYLEDKVMELKKTLDKHGIDY